jgi:predicted N-acetyltransferase YhbS
MRLFDVGLGLEVVASNEIGDVVVIIILVVIFLILAFALLLLHALVALRELAERGERVGAELVKNTGDELRKLLILAVAVDGEGVRGYRRVN